MKPDFKRRLLGFVLTKTKALRLLAFAITGWLIGAGVIGEGDKPQIGEAVTVILLGLGSLLIEGRKDGDAKQVQQDHGLKKDGWIGPKSRAVLSGKAAANGHVPVRVKPYRRRGGLQKGYAELPTLIAAMCWALIFFAIVVVMQLGVVRGEPFPDILDTPRIGDAPEVIVWTEPVDRRPFLVRLLESLRPWGEAGARRAKVRVQHDRAELSGYHYDDERVSSRQYVPDQFAVGVSGGADF